MTPDEAARAFGGTAPRPISARENEVFEIALPAGRAALRLHRPGYQPPAAIRAELWWCEALADRGLPVPRPLRTTGGDLLATSAAGRHASAVAWLPGIPLGAAGRPLSGTPRMQATLHRRLGRLIARLHAASATLTLPEGFTRPRWDLPGLLGEAPFWGRFWEHPALSPAESATARRARALLAERIADHAARQPLRLIHADVLRENVIVNGRSLSLIDFDDSGFGFPLYDLGTVLSQNLAEPALPQIAAALTEGYAGTALSDAAMIPVFTLMRCCASVGWLIPRVDAGAPVIARHIARMTGLAETLLAGKSPW